jgi:hypothetical protein
MGRPPGVLVACLLAMAACEREPGAPPVAE